MSQENVEVVRRAYEAWNRGDDEGWASGLARLGTAWHMCGGSATPPKCADDRPQTTVRTISTHMNHTTQRAIEHARAWYPLGTIQIADESDSEVMLVVTYEGSTYVVHYAIWINFPPSETFAHFRLYNVCIGRREASPATPPG
jgi:hypothetical protein